MKLDLGTGKNKPEGYVAMDKRALPHIDIVHDLEIFPYPIEDAICKEIRASQIVEHIKPWLMIDFMNELWRIMCDGGVLDICHPYGINQFYIGDPTHCNPCNEYTWQYFDPKYAWYEVYEPSPWHIESINLKGTLLFAILKKSGGKNG